QALVLPVVGVQLALVAAELVASVGGLEQLAAELVGRDVLLGVEERLGAVVVAERLASLVQPGYRPQHGAVDPVRRRAVQVEADVLALASRERLLRVGNQLVPGLGWD